LHWLKGAGKEQRDDFKSDLSRLMEKAVAEKINLRKKSPDDKDKEKRLDHRPLIKDLRRLLYVSAKITLFVSLVFCVFRERGRQISKFS
jgi:hypothetical protein